jgi:hypothetical protein
MKPPLLLAACLACIGVPQNGDTKNRAPLPPELSKLAHARGAWAARSFESTNAEREWSYNIGEVVPATMAFFPAGTADGRYFLSRFEVGERPIPGGQGSYIIEAYFLNFQTKQGATIRPEWLVRLDTCPVPKSFEGMGTLEAMLARRGLRVAGPVPQAVTASLKAHRPLVGYGCFIDEAGVMPVPTAEELKNADPYDTLPAEEAWMTPDEAKWLAAHRTSESRSVDSYRIPGTTPWVRMTAKPADGSHAKSAHGSRVGK